MSNNVLNFQSVRLDEDKNVLVILDQTVLPNSTHYLELETVEDVWDAICKLQVRGAPAKIMKTFILSL